MAGTEHGWIQRHRRARPITPRKRHAVGNDNNFNSRPSLWLSQFNHDTPTTVQALANTTYTEPNPPPYPRATLNLVTLTASPPATAARLRNVGSKSESSCPDCPDGSESDTSGSAIPGISSAGLNTMSATTGLACWVSTITRNRSYRNVNGISSTLSSSSAGTSAPLRTSDHFRRRQVVGQRG